MEVHKRICSWMPILWVCLLNTLCHHARASSSSSSPALFNLSLPHQHPFPGDVALDVQRKLNESISRRLLLTDPLYGQSPPPENPSCLTGNPIDDCWRCVPNWAENRQLLADCSIGFGRGTLGGKGGRFYVVTDSSDRDAANPVPGTLRHAVIQSEPLWIIFAGDMLIKLKHELIVSSYKTIDGRGANIHITGHGCITIQQVSHVIIHNVHVHHCKPSGNALIASSPTHVGPRGDSDGDGISISASDHIWVDHCSLGYCTDGLIDAILGSTAITISNSYFSHHDKVMLLGHDDRYLPDSGMQVTIAFNHFGEALVQRMPRCRHGYIHVANNDFTAWEMYAIGGSANPTINSQGNRYTAPYDSNAKEVTKRVDSDEREWSGWNWRTDGDMMVNGAYFVPSGEGAANEYARATSVQPRAAALIDQLTLNAGVFGDPTGRNGQGGAIPGNSGGDGRATTTGRTKGGDPFSAIFRISSAPRPTPNSDAVLRILLTIIVVLYVTPHRP
ncbi:PREDICTED: probable pectate lyase 5 [Tarenaya hassleriana]|uniref:probable pectate lyase 5 n=1 Tax=Tarenaya hassleriana TaxID=28532 RepID=UPI00053CA2E8|nr:PREDICTED: probable pectate lyase 5 [Tarenaya hassleriana]